MSITKSINGKAIGLGSIIFVVMYLVVTFAINVIASKSENLPSILNWLNLASYITWAICGYLTASIAKKSGILNGVILGLLSPFLVIISIYIISGSSNILQSFKNDWYYWFLMGVITCGLGGLVWDVKSKLINGTTNNG